MRYVSRQIEPQILKAAARFPALILTGPRRAGKTMLLRRLFPKAAYVLLEDPDMVARVRSDPNAFLDELPRQVILDEIQNTPELFNYIRTRIDARPRNYGRWMLTGSQEAPLMRGVTESMAGRAALFQLMPFSADETPKAGLFRGGFPEVLDKPDVAQVWFRSYIQTYLERDVRAVSIIRDLSLFRRFLALLASRCGQLLNKTDLAAPLGVTIPTITQWMSILEVTGQIILVPPFYENFGKRLVKSPKLYFMDSGLACHLLGMESENTLRNSVFLGPVFEGYVAAEILKQQLGLGRARELYYFRDMQGLEVDFIVPQGGKKLALLEAKATQTPRPDMGHSVRQLLRKMDKYTVSGYVVHRPRAREASFSALAPGITALPANQIRTVLA